MKYQTLKGMNDIYFKEAKKYDLIIKNATKVFLKYGYSRVITPNLEETELFKRSVGDETDVVNKEMYTFNDKGDRSVTLRPEGTAGVLRAYINGGLHISNPINKWFYYGTMYRYERPQKGRYREFHQIGVECFGIKSAFFDATVVKMAIEFLEKLNIKDLSIQINSLGNVSSRKKYIKVLQEFLIENYDRLSEDSKVRTYKNPLRVLDSKDKNDKEILKLAPNLHDYFDEESLTYFKDIQRYLEKLNIKYELNTNLVRGLDYYTDLVFEIVSTKDNHTILGGGRYDNLANILDNKDIPAIGFAAGIERISSLIQDNILEEESLDVYLVYFDQISDFMIDVVSKLIDNDIRVDFEYKSKSFNYQMKRANKLNAKYVLILGEDEIKENMLTLKNMKTSIQEKISLNEAIERIKNV